MHRWNIMRADSMEVVEAESLEDAIALSGGDFVNIHLRPDDPDPAIEEAKAASRATGLAKLVALGLTEDEALALVGG